MAFAEGEQCLSGAAHLYSLFKAFPCPTCALLSHESAGERPLCPSNWLLPEVTQGAPWLIHAHSNFPTKAEVRFPGGRGVSVDE